MILPPDNLTIDNARRLQLLGIPDDVAVRLAAYVHRLNDWQAGNAQQFPHLIQGWHDTAPDDRPDPPAGTLAEWFDLDPGATGAGRYIRVVSMRREKDGTPVPPSVHAFIEKASGDVYKPGGWKAPAKGVRYRLTDDDSFVKMLARLDGYGGYLYADRAR